MTHSQLVTNAILAKGPDTGGDHIPGLARKYDTDPVPSTVHTFDLDATSWEAMNHGKLRFYVTKTSHLIQTGDVLVFKKLSRTGGYETLPGAGMFSAKELSFHAGWIQPSDPSNGIAHGYVVVQLDRRLS